jgi:hypothetical protein
VAWFLLSLAGFALCTELNRFASAQVLPDARPNMKHCFDRIKARFWCCMVLLLLLLRQSTHGVAGANVD